MFTSTSSSAPISGWTSSFPSYPSVARHETARPPDRAAVRAGLHVPHGAVRQEVRSEPGEQPLGDRAVLRLHLVPDAETLYLLAYSLHLQHEERRSIHRFGTKRDHSGAGLPFQLFVRIRNGRPAPE